MLKLKVSNERTFIAIKQRVQEVWRTII